MDNIATFVSTVGGAFVASWIATGLNLLAGYALAKLAEYWLD